MGHDPGLTPGPRGPGPRGPWEDGPWRRDPDGRPWPRHRRWQGFGCLFGLIFLVVAGSLVAGAAFVLSRLGIVPGIVVAIVVLGVLVSVGRALRRTGSSLDALLDATRRVEAGDYTARVGSSVRGTRSTRELAAGFDTMAARLEADETRRRALLADVSHELRTPLAVIAGNLEAIMDGVYPADEAHLSPILEETQVMARLIDDLRTLTLSEAGTLALHREPTDVELLIADAVRVFTLTAGTGQVRLVSEVAELPTIDVDPVRIREVLSNLLANAIRHTPAGGTVTIACSATEDGRGVRIRVADTGSGIAPELLPHVFERFAKGAGSRGSGLGLAIARGLVEAHGGRISVDSIPGAGTTFTVELPSAA